MSDPLLNNNSTSSAVSSTSGQSASAFAASLVTSIVVFAVEGLLFLLIKDRFSRIYQPRTYLVPERQRTTAASPGWWKWIKPVLSTSNSDFVQKCGLDAYFFLRYLRTLLKIFVPAALAILPILLPLNSIGGRGPRYALNDTSASNVTGLDQLSWGNVTPSHTHRYWAHWLLALFLIVWVCFIAFDELRGYIRMRQAYLTSAQHRLRASATTVLVSAIPQKWCNVETLDGLFDVFPGGLRNIWINRNFDELSDKVQKRDSLALKLEAAETELIKKCYKKNEGTVAKAAKETGKKLTKNEQKQKDQLKDRQATQAALGKGLTSGDPHQVSHTVRDAIDGNRDEESTSSNGDLDQKPEGGKPRLPIPVLGEGFQAMTQGIGAFGKGILGGLRGVNKGVNDTIDTTNGFVTGPDAEAGIDSSHHNWHNHRTGTGLDGAATAAAPGSHRNEHLRNGTTYGTRQSPQTNFSPTSQAESESNANWGRGRTHERLDDDQQPLGQPSPADTDPKGNTDAEPRGKLYAMKKAVGLAAGERESVEYPEAFIQELDEDGGGAVWKKYIEEKDRDTMRLPIFGWQWMISLPFVGEKVDTIYHCRREVARLNVEIEDDQAHPERFPLMNSAFVQFNHQVAAHMACQCVSHHLPQQMAPRLVEIDPNDVIWENMSTPWWQSYIRTACVVAVIAAMIVLWAIPVAFTGSLSQLNSLATQITWLHWVLKIPSVIRSVLQGVLPAAFLAILMFLLPVILRMLVKLEGTQSGMLIELSVQRYYFFFLFVQLFLVVSIASAATTLIGYFKHPGGVLSLPSLLATNIPRASNYFFSYMLLQALSVSAGALVQVGGLLSWFIFAPLLDTTARDKFKRQTKLSEIQWGTFFPVYSNLACIGLIYSVISPLILVFNIITFALFWFVYRYNTLYVTKFTRDTGGLLFPNAINAMFTGLYVMEVVLIALFFLVRDENDNVACQGQGIGMVIIFIFTAVYQYLLNDAFAPLFRYLPITLEDDAVRRDEEFARAMHNKQGLIENEVEGQDLQDELERRERRSREEDREAQEYELQQIAREKARRAQQQHPEELPELEPYEVQNPEITLDLDKESKGFRIMRKTVQKTADAANATLQKLPSRAAAPTDAAERRKSAWADRSRNRRSQHFGEYSSASRERLDQSDSFSTHSAHHHGRTHRTRRKSPARKALDTLDRLNPLLGNAQDLEAQQQARNQLSNALFSGVNDELEDLTPEERDRLVQRAFQHAALRARRPVIWIPRDQLGVSDDEVRKMAAFSRNLWVSNVRQGLDSKGKCVYSGAPPDFSEADLIQL